MHLQSPHLRRSRLRTGTDDLGMSGSNCNHTTNICSPANNEYRATAEPVNAEAWMSIINGATGIEWFCDDSLSYTYCLGDNGDPIANAIQANLTYVDTAILNYAPVINSPATGMCTMITGASYTSFTTSCSNGILTLSTGNSSLPASALVKNYSGVTYLLAQPAHNGTGTLTHMLGASGYLVASGAISRPPQWK